MRKLTWFRRVALGLLAVPFLCAQTPPEYTVPEADAPAGVREALRARVIEFFGYHVGPANRKAIDLVAEDTKDYYFQSGKVKLLGFELKSMEFTPDFQKAYVKVDARQLWEVQEFSTEVTQPANTTWKIENGNWYWFLDVQNAVVWRTPMGPSAPSITQTAGPKTNPDGTLYIPPDFGKPERLQEQAQAILSQAGLDKDAVTFTFGTPGEDRVTFHNGFSGQVSLKLYGDPHIPGLSIALDKTDVFARQDASVVFNYDPPADARLDPTNLSHTLRLELIPFNQTYPIRVTIRPAQ